MFEESTPGCARNNKHLPLALPVQVWNLDWTKYTLSSTCLAQICLCAKIFIVLLAQKYDCAKKIQQMFGANEWLGWKFCCLLCANWYYSPKQINKMVKQAIRVNKMTKVSKKSQNQQKSLSERSKKLSN